MMRNQRLSLTIIIVLLLVLGGCKNPENVATDPSIEAVADDPALEQESFTDNGLNAEELAGEQADILAEDETTIAEGDAESFAFEEAVDEEEQLDAQDMVAQSDTGLSEGDSEEVVADVEVGGDDTDNSVVEVEAQESETVAAEELETPMKEEAGEEESGGSEDIQLVEESIEETMPEILPEAAPNPAKEIVAVIEPVVPETVPVEIPNNSPLVNNEVLYITEEQVLTGIDVLANDSDEDGDPLTILSFTQGNKGGRVDKNEDGSFTYTPLPDFYGEEQFSYVVGDNKGGEATATATIWVAGVNELDVNNEELVVDEDEELKHIDVLANDVDPEGDKLTIKDFSQGLNGGVVTKLDNGLFNYKPAPNYHGIDVFVYTVVDGAGAEAAGAVIVNIASVDDVPVAKPDTAVARQSTGASLMLLKNDSGLGDGAKISLVSGPSHGKLNLSANGEASYVPDDGFEGEDSFTYKLQDDDGDESIASVTITVECDVKCSQTFQLSWNPSPSAGVTGYKVHVGTAPDNFDEIINVGSVTNMEYVVETKGTYYFAVSAINDQGVESDLSEQVSAIY